jgi:hypothetical protein
MKSDREKIIKTLSLQKCAICNESFADCIGGAVVCAYCRLQGLNQISLVSVEACERCKGIKETSRSLFRYCLSCHDMLTIWITSSLKYIERLSLQLYDSVQDVRFVTPLLTDTARLVCSTEIQRVLSMRADLQSLRRDISLFQGERMSLMKQGLRATRMDVNYQGVHPSQVGFESDPIGMRRVANMVMRMPKFPEMIYDYAMIYTEGCGRDNFHNSHQLLHKKLRAVLAQSPVVRYLACRSGMTRRLKLMYYNDDHVNVKFEDSTYLYFSFQPRRGERQHGFIGRDTPVGGMTACEMMAVMIHTIHSNYTWDGDNIVLRLSPKPVIKAMLVTMNMLAGYRKFVASSMPSYIAFTGTSRDTIVSYNIVPRKGCDSSTISISSSSHVLTMINTESYPVEISYWFEEENSSSQTKGPKIKLSPRQQMTINFAGVSVKKIQYYFQFSMIHHFVNGILAFSKSSGLVAV